MFYENWFFPELLYDAIFQCHIQWTTAFSIGSNNHFIWNRPQWILNKDRVVPSRTMTYFTQGVSVPQSEAALKVSYVSTKELSSHAQLYYARERKGRYVTPFDFCFVNKWQRGEKLSSTVCGSHQIAPNMARKGRSGAAAYPPNWEDSPTYPSTLPTLFHKQLPRWTAAWDSTHSSTEAIWSSFQTTAA